MSARRQRDALVARAIVGYEAGRSGEILTVPSLVSKYGLEWGLYFDKRDHATPRAHQLLRNAFNDAVEDGRLRRLPERDGYWNQYVSTQRSEDDGGTDG